MTGTCFPFQPGENLPSGRPDLAKALDYVKDNSFQDARPGVPRVVVPIVHIMSSLSQNLEEIPKAGQRLKDQCTSIVAVTVDSSTLDEKTVQEMVSQPHPEHIWSFKDFDSMEFSVDHLHCDQEQLDLSTLGCDQAEVVFMVEYARTDSQCSIDHAGDFIKELVDKWRVDDQHVRVGVVAYHDTVGEVVHIDQFPNDASGLKTKIGQVTGWCTRGTQNSPDLLQPSGSADLGKAFDFVRQNAFTGARQGVPKIVIPIIHQMPRSDEALDALRVASLALRADCDLYIKAYAVSAGLFGTPLNTNSLHNIVSQPYNNYLTTVASYTSLENNAKNLRLTCPSAPVDNIIG